MMMMQRMKESIYTQTLKRAAQAEGGTAALASLLHVPASRKKPEVPG
jgi:hypothetical protein